MNRVLIPLEVEPIRAPDRSSPILDMSGESMGTTWTVKFAMPNGGTSEAIRRGIEQALAEIVTQMSTWDEASDLSRFNRSAAASWHTLPPQFFDVLSTAMNIAQLSDGAYDPTIGPLVNLWGFGPQQRRVDSPPAAVIAQQLAQCGWSRVTLDPVRRQALQPGDIHIDLSAIAKGYGVDQVARYLRSIGCVSYLVEVGGELIGHGIKPDGHPWWVELERPPGASNTNPTIVALHGLAVATSGDYRRYFDAAGIRYSHTIDPRSGYPVAHGLASVTVLHSQCMQADALSTALTVMGTANGLAFAKRHDIAALFIERDGDQFVEFMSPTLIAMLE